MMYNDYIQEISKNFKPDSTITPELLTHLESSIETYEEDKKQEDLMWTKIDLQVEYVLAKELLLSMSCFEFKMLYYLRQCGRGQTYNFYKMIEKYYDGYQRVVETKQNFFEYCNQYSTQLENDDQSEI